MPILPKIIFAEDHLNPITAKVLNKLVPKLKELGYETFLDEKAEGSTLQDYLKSIEEDNSIWQRWVDKLKKDLDIDIQKEDWCAHPFFSDKEGKEIAYFLKRHAVKLSYIPFFENLQINKVNYKSIDLKIMNHANLEPSVIAYLNFSRVKQMSRSYLNSSEPAFGWVGYNHIKELQKEISENLSKIGATDQFCFFAISFGTQPYKFLNEEALPFGISLIDSAKNTEDEMVDLIIKYIKEKQAALAPKPQEKPDSKTSFYENNTVLFNAKNLLSGPVVNKEKNQLADAKYSF